MRQKSQQENGTMLEVKEKEQQAEAALQVALQKRKIMDYPPSKKSRFTNHFVNENKKLDLAGVQIKKELKLPSLNEILENDSSKKFSSKLVLPSPDIVVLNDGKVPAELDISTDSSHVKCEPVIAPSKVTYSNLILTPNVKLFSPNSNIDLGVRKLCCILKQSANPESELDYNLISEFMESICCSSPFNEENMRRIINSLQTNNLQFVLTVARMCASYTNEMLALTDDIKNYMEKALPAFIDNDKEEFYEALLSSFSHLNLWSEVCSNLDDINVLNVAPGIKGKALQLGMNANFPGRDCVTVCAYFAPKSVKNGQFADMQGLALLWVRCIEENEGLWAKSIGVAISKDKTFKTCVIEFLEQSIPTWGCDNIMDRAVELLKSWSYILPEIKTAYAKRFAEIELPPDSFQTLVNKLSTSQGVNPEVDTFLVYVGIGFVEHLALELGDWASAEGILCDIILDKDMCYSKVDLGNGPVHSVLFVMEVLVHAEKFDRAIEVMNNCPMIIQNLNGANLVLKRSTLLIQIMNGFVERGELESARIVSDIILDFLSKDDQFSFNEMDAENIWELFLSKYINQLEEKPEYIAYTKFLDLIHTKLRKNKMAVKLSRDIWSRLTKIGMDMKYEPRDSMLKIVESAVEDEAYPKINVKDRFLFLPDCPEICEINLLLYAYLRELKAHLLENLADNKESVNLLDLCHLTLVEVTQSNEEGISKISNDEFVTRVSDALKDLVYIENSVKFSRGNDTNVILDNIDVYNCVFKLE